MRMLALGGLAIAGVAAVALSVAAAKMAGDFESSTERLVTSAGEQQGALGMVRSGILKLSVDAATSTEQLSAAMYKVESSNYHAANGLLVLTAAAQGAKTENADLTTVSQALLGVLTNYHMPATQATSAMDGLIAVVKNGNTTLQDLSGSMAQVLPTAASLGISFAQVGGAIDTMTSKTMPAEQAAQNLAHVLVALSAPSKTAVQSMTEVGLSAQGVKDALAHQGLPEALQMIENAVGKKFPAGSVEYTTALKNIMGGLVGYKLAAQLTGASLKDTQAHIDAITAAMKNGSGTVDGFTQIQNTFNFAMDSAKQAVAGLMIKLGMGLLPILTPLVSNIAKGVTAFTDWATSGHALGDMFSLTGKYSQILLPILLGLGAMILAVLVPAFAALDVTLSPFTLIVVGIGLAVAGLTALFLHFYQTNAGFKAVVDDIGKAFKQAGEWIGANFMPVVQKIGAFLQANVLPVLQQVGAFIAGVFQPVWKQLVDLWNSQLLPIFKQLMPALQQMTPLFQLLGVIIGGLVVVAIGILIGLISGLAKGISYMVEGLANVVTGIVRIFSGVAQVVGGFIQLIVDLVHGNFSGMLKDLDQIKTGILNIFSGLWQAVAGLFQAAWGLISGIVGGFIQGIISFFQGLFDRLVGHSIIPDMINGIINWFSQLPGRVGPFIVNMVSTVVGKLAGLLSSGLTWASNFVSGLFNALGKLAGQAGSAMQTAVSKILSVLGGAISSAAAAGLNIVVAIANGIISGIASAIGNAMNQVGNFIQSHLPHSPAKMGPLVGLDQAGANIPAEIAKGMARGAPALQTSLNMMLSPVIPSSLAFSGTIIPANVSNAGSQQPIVVQAGDLYIDGQRLTQAQLPYLMNAIRLATGAKF